MQWLALAQHQAGIAASIPFCGARSVYALQIMCIRIRLDLKPPSHHSSSTQVISQLQERDALFHDKDHLVYLRGYPPPDNQADEFVDAKNRLTSLRSAGSFGSGSAVDAPFYDAASANGSFMSLSTGGEVRAWFSGLLHGHLRGLFWMLCCGAAGRVALRSDLRSLLPCDHLVVVVAAG